MIDTYREQDDESPLPPGLAAYQERSAGDDVIDDTWSAEPTNGWRHNMGIREPEPIEARQDTIKEQGLGMDTFSEGPANAEQIPEAPPKRRGRPPRDPSMPRPERKTRTTRSRSRSMETQIGGTLALLNMAFLFVPEPWRNDALSDTEITALAKSLDAAASQNPRMRRYLSAVMVEGGAMADLVIVVGIIAGSRLSRHGLIDPAFDTTLQGFLDRKMGSDGAAETAPIS